MAQNSIFGGGKQKEKNKNKQTYTQTNTSDLSGTNRSQAYGNGAPKQRETGKTFTSSAPTNVKPKEVKSNATKYQSTLDSVSDSSNKKVQSLFSKPKVDTQSKKQTQKSEYDVDTSKFKYKKDYTREDRDRLDSELSTMIEENPYTNEDAMYKDMWSDDKKKGFAEQNQKIAEKAQEYSTAKTEVALTKMGEDAQKNGPIRDEDVFENVNGRVKAKDFSNDIKSASDNSARIKEEIKGLEEELTQYSPSIENAQIIGDLNNRIRILRQELNESNSALDNLQNKQKYQQSRIGKATLDYAKENNDVDTLKELGRQFDSYDDTFIERRLTNIAKIGVDMTTAVMNIVDIALDLGGDALALASEKYAENMYKNGDIDDEQYNAYLTKAKRYASFDANDPTTASYAMRQLSNQMAYQIANGEDGILKFVGQGLDSTANFLVQFLALGEMGSLTMMGTQSGTQKYFENLEKGYDKTTALLNGIATGVTSFLTEKIGMDNFTSLLTGTAGSKVYAQILDGIARNNGMEIEALARLWMSQGMAEGLEEFVEGNVDYVLDSITAKIANGEPIEYNAGDIFYSMAVGGFSGLLMGGVATTGMAQFVVNTREQYNQLQADVDTAKRIYAEASVKNKQANAEIDSLMNSGEYYNQDTLARISNLEQEISANEQNMASLQGAILAGQDALNAFSNQSQLMGVEFANEQAEPRPDSRGETETLAEALRPNIDELVQNDQKRQALEENIVRSATDFLAMKGVNMQADQFVQLGEAQRNYLLNNAEKTQASCPNANIGYATEFYYPDENGNIVDHLRNANAIVIKNEGGRPTIVVNPKGETSAVVSAVHEIIHTIEGTPEYNALFEFVFEGGISGEHFKEKYAELTGDRYAYTKKKGFEGYREAMKECLTCTVTEDMMNDAGAQAFIDHMAKYNTSTAYKLMYKLSEMTGLFKDNSALGRINAMLTDALSKENVAYTQSGIQYQKGEPRKVIRNTLNNIESGRLAPNDNSYQIALKDSISKLADWEVQLIKDGWLSPNDMPTMTISSISNSQYDSKNPATKVFQSSLHSNGTDFNTGATTQEKSPIERYIVENVDVLYKNPIAVFEGSDGKSVLLVTKALDKSGGIIILPVHPNMRGTYSDFDLNKKANQSVASGRSLYGKNNGIDLGMSEMIRTTKAFLNKGNMLWAENGMNKAQVEKAVEDLIRKGNGNTYVSPDISSQITMANQLDLIESKTGIDLDQKTAQNFSEYAEAEHPLNSQDLDMANAMGFVTVYSDSPINVGSEVNLSHGLYSQSVPTDSLIFDKGQGYYAPVTERDFKAEQIAKEPVASEKDTMEIVDIVGEMNELKSLARNGDHDAKKEISESKAKQKKLLASITSTLDKRFPDRYHSETFDKFIEKYNYNKRNVQHDIDTGKYKTYSNDELIDLVKKLADDYRTAVLGVRGNSDESNLENYLDESKKANKALRIIAELDAVSSLIEQIELTDEQKEDIRDEYYLRKVLGDEKGSLIPNGARKLKAGETPRLDILIGPAGAGKSHSFAKDILKQYQSVDLDPDYVKEMFDHGFRMFNGIATPYANTTSEFFDKLRDEFINDKKYNLLLQGTGKTPSSMIETIDWALRLGYDVYLHSAETTSAISFASALDRGAYSSTEGDVTTYGRITPINFLSDVDTNPAKTYDIVKDYYILTEGENGIIEKKGVIQHEQKLRYGYKQTALLEAGKNPFLKGKDEGNWGVSRTEGKVGMEGVPEESLQGYGNDARGNRGGNSRLNGQQISYSRKSNSDDFIRVQKESERVSRETRWGSPSRHFNENLQRRLSRVFSEELHSRNYSDGNADGLLKNTGDFKILKDVDGQTFHDIFNIARTYLPFGELVDVHPVETNEDWTGYNDTKNYLSSDGLSGFAITKDGDLISVFNLNRTKKGFLKSIAPFIMDNAKTLDCYVLNNKVNLQQLYHDIFGFETKETVDYDYKYDHDDIGKRYKEPKVAFMYNPKTTIQYSAGSRKAVNNLLNSNKPELKERGKALVDSSIEAMRLERQGMDMDDIWYKTGWVRKSDGRWRFQFYDGAEKTIQNIDNLVRHVELGMLYDLSDFVGKENVLFDMYPDLRYMNVMFYDDGDANTYGMFKESGASSYIRLNLARFREGADPNKYEYLYDHKYEISEQGVEDLSKTFFHELQHAIQAQEEMEGGSNPEVARYEIWLDNLQKADEQIASLTKELRDVGIENIDEALDNWYDYLEGKSGSKISPLQASLLMSYAKAENLRDISTISSSEAFDRYHNNLGEVEAREEADNTLNEIDRTLPPFTEGLLKSEKAKSDLGLSNDVQYSNMYNPNIQFSRQSGHTNENDVSTNESMEEGLAKNAEAVEKYGAFDYGMNPARETDIARRTDNGPTFQTVRTIANSMHIDDDFARRMQAKTGLGGFVKEVQHDKDVIKRSADYIREHGFAKSYEHVIKANDLNNANRDLTTGILLMDEMESMGLRGTPEYEKLVDKCVQMGNALGVGLRTVSLFKRMSPQGQVITIESEIQRIQEGLNERYKDRAPQLQVPREMLDEYLNPKTKEERRTELRGEIAKNIADQIPPTIWEKLNAFRHLSMLFNPRTWVKNRVANEVFGYINEMTRMVRTVGESVYSQFDENFEKEAGIYNPLSTQDRAWYKDFVNDYKKNVKSNDGKYVSAIDAGDILLDTEFGREISENRKQFSTGFMNWFAETNKKMLSDDPSKSKAYAKSMVGWFKAHNLTPETATPQQMEKAREFALKEALYATFNTDNMLAKAIIQYEKYGDKHFGKVAGKVNRMVVESFIPFKRTPLNLMKTGMSYTPIGLVKSLVYDGLIKVRNGDMTANQFINNMAQGLTGTGLFLFGALLKSLGVFRTKDDDKDRKKYFDKDNGEQDYSLDFGDFTYTIDWLDPLIVPLAMGAEFSKLIEDGDFTSDELYALGTAMAQPIFDTSMMSGITNNLKSYASDPAEYTTGLGANAITNYASQYIPSVFGALARTVDDTRRTTAVNKGKLDKFGQSALSKIPFASKTLEPYVNKQGEEQKNPTLGLEKYGKAGGLVGRALLNFLSPGYYADKEIDKFDEEMYRLYNETGEIGVLPSSTTKSLTYQKDKKDFTKKEYTQWHKTRYKIESEYVNSFIGSSDYKSMSDEERVKTIENIRKYAQEVAKKEFLAGRGISYDPKALKNAQGAMNSGMELYDYYNYKANTEKQEDKIKWMEDNHLTDKEKEYLWGLEGYKTSYEDVYKKVFGKGDEKTSKKKSSSTSSKKASSKTSSKSSKKSTKSGGATSGTIRRNMASEVSGTIKPHVTQQKKLNSNFYSAYANTFTRKPTQGGSKNTIVCPNCGNRVSAGTSVCPNCGTKL